MIKAKRIKNREDNNTQLRIQKQRPPNQTLINFKEEYRRIYVLIPSKERYTCFQ